MTTKPTPVKMTPGDELHLTLLMAPWHLNLVVGEDREHLLAYARAVWDAALDAVLTQDPGPSS